MQKICLLGIGGIGVSALAKWYICRGHKVHGYDDGADPSMLENDLPDAHIARSVEEISNIIPSCDFVVYSDALSPDHPGRLAAENHGIPNYSYFESLGGISKETNTIAISGTHGKSTTTAMTGLLFETTETDPTVIVGTKVPQWKSNFRNGKSNILIVEADEYKKHLLKLEPRIAVILNIEADHLEYYGDENAIVDTFVSFANKESVKTVICNIDNAIIREKLIPEINNKNIITFGFKSESANIQGNVSNEKALTQTIEYIHNNEKYEIRLHVPGKGNAYNALAAISIGIEKGFSHEQIKNGLESFTGTWRRFEIISQTERQIVVSDYAHHPTEIRNTISAARTAFPEYEIVAIFEPHMKSRTHDFLDDFADALSLADKAILLPIFEPKGREENIDISSQDIVNRIPDKKDANAFSSYDEYLKSFKMPARSKHVLLYMGAGPIDTLARK